MSKVRVRVPATTANLGPGFDCLGCALSLYAEFDCEPLDRGLRIEGCPEKYQNEDNLFVRAFRRAEDEMGVSHLPLCVRIRTDVPVSRGLGSSATLLAGGAAAANAMHGNRLSQEALLRLLNELEGHPDNVAPALLGGMCASLVQDGQPVTVPIGVAENIGWIALIPNFETQTHAMRGVLLKEVPLQDAVFNASHLAVLIKAFETGDLTLLGKALDDRLHQPYRKPLIHEYDRAERAARAAGCAAFCISGSGSTCLGVAEAARTHKIAAAIEDALGDSPYQWRALPLTVDKSGAVCTLVG